VVGMLSAVEATDVVIGSQSGGLTSISGSDGAIRWQTYLGARTDGSPIVADFQGDGTWEVGISTESGEFFVRSTGISGTLYWAKPRGDLYNSGNALHASAFARSICPPTRRSSR